MVSVELRKMTESLTVCLLLLNFLVFLGRGPLPTQDVILGFLFLFVGIFTAQEMKES